MGGNHSLFLAPVKLSSSPGLAHFPPFTSLSLNLNKLFYLQKHLLLFLHIKTSANKNNTRIYEVLRIHEVALQLLGEVQVKTSSAVHE